MLLTLFLSVVFCAAITLMLLAAVAFIQNEKFFSSAPKEAREVIHPREKELFFGARIIGWTLMGFAVVLITFLVLATLIVFAVLLFLSYENMYNNLILEVESGTQNGANDLASDIAAIAALQDVPFEYSINDDGTDNFKNSRLIDRFVNSETYRSNGAVYITDKDGMIICRNSLVTDVEDILLTNDDVPLYIAQEDVLNLLAVADEIGFSRTGSNNTGRIISISCVRISGTPYFVVVSNSEGTEATINE